MAVRCFVDTGAYFALFFIRDQYHQESRQIWDRLNADKALIWTTNHVLDELATLLARKTTYEFSATKMQGIYDSEGMRIERSSRRDEVKAIDYFRKFADQKVSFTDCLSFAIMNRVGLKEVFTFDRHFGLAGFKLIQ